MPCNFYLVFCMPTLVAPQSGDAVASMFASVRDEAIAHAQQRNAFFAEATAA
jgi:hypothetical protein